MCSGYTTILLQRQTVLPGKMNSSPMQSLSTQCQLLAILLYNNSWRKLCCQADFFLNCRKNRIQSSRSEQSKFLQFSHISTLKKYELELLTPLASKPEQSRAARQIHTASIPLRCCSQPSHPLVDIVTYSVCRFPATVTNTEQMPTTVVIPAVALMA